MGGKPSAGETDGGAGGIESIVRLLGMHSKKNKP